MNADLIKLKALQELDQELARLGADQKQAKARLEQIVTDRKRRNALIEKLQQDISAVAAQRRGLEADLKSREQQRSKFLKQQEMVKTPKELSAITHELEQCDADISRLEENILGLMEQEEQKAADFGEKKQQADKLEAKALEEESRLRTAGAERAQLVTGLTEDRIVSANQLSQELRDTYEWLLKKHGTSVVTGVTGSACGGCGGMLVPQLVLQAKSGEELVRCNHCNRYLSP